MNEDTRIILNYIQSYLWGSAMTIWGAAIWRFAGRVNPTLKRPPEDEQETTPAALARPLERVTGNMAHPVVEFRQDTDGLSVYWRRLPKGLTPDDMRRVAEALNGGARFSRRGLEGVISQGKYALLYKWLDDNRWVNGETLHGQARANINSYLSPTARQNMFNRRNVTDGKPTNQATTPKNRPVGGWSR